MWNFFTSNYLRASVFGGIGGKYCRCCEARRRAHLMFPGSDMSGWGWEDPLATRKHPVWRTRGQGGGGDGGWVISIERKVEQG